MPSPWADTPRVRCRTTSGWRSRVVPATPGEQRVRDTTSACNYLVVNMIAKSIAMTLRNITGHSCLILSDAGRILRCRSEPGVEFDG